MKHTQLRISDPTAAKSQATNPNTAPSRPVDSRSTGTAKTGTAELLLAKYGPLLSHSQLSEILHRSESGLRYSICTGTGQYLQGIRRARRRIGRRVLYRTVDIADVIENSGDVER